MKSFHACIGFFLGLIVAVYSRLEHPLLRQPKPPKGKYSKTVDGGLCIEAEWFSEAPGKYSINLFVRGGSRRLISPKFTLAYSSEQYSIKELDVQKEYIKMINRDFKSLKLKSSDLITYSVVDANTLQTNVHNSPELFKHGGC